MTKPTIVTRAGKGSALTWTEGDTNLTNLRDATIAIKAGTGGTDVVSDLNGTVTLVAGTNVTLSGDNTAKTVTINAAGGSGITDLVQDTSPQLGGNLDVNGNSIVSASNGNINITPNGTGSVVIDGNALPQDSGLADQVLITDGAGQTSWSEVKTVYATVYNAEATTISKGQPVYLFGAQGANPSVKLALNTGDTTSAKTYGLAAENITAGSTGRAVIQGVLKNINTSTYAEGDSLYLGSTAGALTTTKPYAPNHLVYIGTVTVVGTNNGRITVRIQNGYELDEIHDANIGHNVSLANKDYLVYNSSNSLWENRQLDIVNDTTPQLGGHLDVNGNQITSSSNGNIAIVPNGSGNIQLTPATGKITLGAVDWPTTAGTNGQVLTTNGTGTATWSTPSSGGLTDIVNDTTPQLGGDLDVNGKSIVTVSNGNINITPNGTGNINLSPASGKVNISATSFPTGAGTNGQYLKTDGAGNASWATVTASPAGSNQQIQFNSSGSLGASSSLYYDGVSLKVTSGNIESLYSNGDEGGEFRLATATTNTTLAGGSIAIDINQNRLRFFETGGTNRGAYIDLSAASAGVGSNLLGSGGATNLDGLSDVVITAAATGDILRFDGTNWVDTAESSLTVGTATVGSTVTLTADNSTNATNYPLFVNAATGNLSPRTDTGFTYNPSTGMLTSTGFTGTLTGNATNVSGTVAIANGGTGATSAPAAMAALMGFTTTATAGGTTSLSNTSTYYQVFTGTLGQTVQVPNTNSISTGWSLHIVNNSTQALTIQGATGSNLGSLPAGVTMMATCLSTANNNAASWETGYTDFSTITGTGANVLGTNPTMSGATISGLTLSQTLTASGSAGTSGQFLQSTGTGVQWATSTSPSIAVISQDAIKGTLITGSTYRQTISETLDPSGIITVASNQFTVAAGTYIVEFIGVNKCTTVGAVFQHGLYNVTGAVNVDNYAGGVLSDGTNATRWVFHWSQIITPASSTTYEFRCLLDATSNTVALVGTSASFRITKVA